MKTLDRVPCCEEILKRIEGLTVLDRPRWGAMSAHGMVCHLSDALRLTLREKSAEDASSWFLRTVVKWDALRVPMKWPKNVPTRPELKQGVGGTCPTEFDADRRELLALVERFKRTSVEAMPGHPMFGRMTEFEWRRWGYLHADHHLRQFGR
jgi:hypothetical protein